MHNAVLVSGKRYEEIHCKENGVENDSKCYIDSDQVVLYMETLEQSVKEVRKQVTWVSGRAFQGEGRASTKALRWECAHPTAEEHGE